MYKILVVDDNKVIRKMLTEMLRKIDDVEITGECETGIAALGFLQNNRVDIIMLDVEMPGMTGLELLRLLPEKPITILITAKTAYAVEAFEFNVIDYLLKPFSISRVILAINKAKELLSMKNARLNEVSHDHIFIKENKVIRKIMLNEILWFEAKGDYVKIVTIKLHYIVHSTLKNLEEKLPATEFVRIHRGYMVPVSKIDYIEDGIAYVESSPLPVSETYKNDLLKKLHLI